jgi:hypothetical protein
VPLPVTVTFQADTNFVVELRPMTVSVALSDFSSRVTCDSDADFFLDSDALSKCHNSKVNDKMSRNKNSAGTVLEVHDSIMGAYYGRACLLIIWY